MSGKEDEFFALLRSTFKVEASEHLQVISAGLLDIENARGDARPKIERVFRAAHTLKGAARAVDFKEIEALCQSLEDTFASWKRGESAPSPETFDALHRALDAIASSLGTSNPAAPPLPPAAEDAPPAPATTTEQPLAGEITVRVAVGRLETQLLHAEEILNAKLAAGQRAIDLRELAGRFEVWQRQWASLEPMAAELRQSPSASAPLKRIMDFLDDTAETMKMIGHQAASLSHLAEQDRHSIGKLVDDLLENSKKLLLLPFATISGAFPKLVRDLSREQAKEADLRIHGEDVEIDKRILEEIKDPIVHLLRNSMDHGIEPPEERVRRGKPRRATITIEVSQVDGNKVQVRVADDGAGIDVEKVKAWAVRHDVITPEEADRMTDSEAQSLIFRSELSTSPIISHLSGRGLGLAIVQEKVEGLGGNVTIESRPGEGATFRIVIPSTRATFRGILVEAGGRAVVVPTSHVERVSRVQADEIRMVQGRDTIAFAGRAIPLVRLTDALEFPPLPSDDPSSGVQVMIVGNADDRAAYIVDRVVAEQEVLVKPLRPPLARVRNVAAATVLGSGQVVPILNVADLLKSARKARSAAARPAVESEEMPSERKSILIAEDSITSRMLLKSILESAGYNVKTAVDGMDAYTLLRTESFDLLVSDVEMPRLSGFDLTARVRADQKLKELPVVLVTALEKREDRIRGIDVGANAYIVKSSFDQSNLLDTVRRLI